MTISLDPLPFGSDYSVKNIPTPSRKEHQCNLIVQSGKFINCLRWRVWHLLNKVQKQDRNLPNQSILNNTSIIADEKETFGFNTGNAGPFIPELQEFEKKFWLIIKNTKYHQDQMNFKTC